MSVDFRLPNINAKTDAEKIAQLTSYLYQLTEQLNFSVNSIETTIGGGIIGHSSESITTPQQKSEEVKLEETYSQVKSMLIKSADFISAISEEFNTTLNSNYVAKSEFGTYLQNSSLTIDGNSTSITQVYRNTESVRRNTENIKNDFPDFDTSNESYIKTGLLYYDGSQPVFGVGVGLLSATTDADGHRLIDKSNISTTFTADEIAFWGNNTKLAYITPTSVYFPSATITGGSININDKFKVASNGDVTISGGVTIGGYAKEADIPSLDGYSTTSQMNAAISNATSGLASESQIPTKTSQLINDEGYQTSSEVNTAIEGKGYQTATQVNSTITSKGYQTSSQVESAITSKGYQTASDVEDIVEDYGYQTASDVENAITSKGYKTESGVTSIIDGYVDTDYVNALGITANKITVKDNIGNVLFNADVANKSVSMAASNITGTLAIGQLPNNIPTTSQVESTITSKGYQTSSQVESAITSKGYQTSAQVESAITSKGYQTSAQVTTITNNTIQTTNVIAQYLKVNAANIQGTLTASQINANGISATDVNISGTINSSNATITGGSISLNGTFQTVINNGGISLRDDDGKVSFNSYGMSYIDNDGYGSAITFSGSDMYIAADDSLSIGGTFSENHLYGTWYLGSSTAVTSDRTKKNTISQMSDAYDVMFDRLIPSTYKYDDGTSNRIHTGFIAQDVEDSVLSSGLTTQDFAAVCYSVGDDGEHKDYALRYEEFVALNTWQIQKLKARVAALEARLG